MWNVFTGPLLYPQHLTSEQMTVEILSVDQLPKNSELDGFRQNAPDICLISGESRCGVWFAPPSGAGERFAVIGHYFAKDSGQSKKLLAAACNLLTKRGTTKVYGPMNGNTWKPYRFVTWSDGSPPFLMEPQNPPEWPEYWRQSGFVPCHEYISTSVAGLACSDPRLARARKRLQDSGITWREVDLNCFEKELAQVYRLSLSAFRQNILYSEIDERTFMDQYLPFVDKIDSRYILIAHDGAGKCCGFVFAMPDLLQLQRGVAMDRLIIKTLAVSEKRRNGGLGAILVDEVQRAALENGLQSAVHALMHQGNVSTNIGKNSTLLRRYTLFAKTFS